MRRSKIRTTAEVVTALGGLCLALTIQMRWVSYGQGSTLRGYDLAAALRRVPDGIGPWAMEAALGIYATAAIGCLTLMSAFLRNPVGVVIRTALVAAPALVLVILSIRGAVPMGHWGGGAVVAFIVGILCAAAAVPLITCAIKESK